MVLGMVLDGDGIPVCSEMWPGNTTDVTTLDRVGERLQRRFGVRRVVPGRRRRNVFKEDDSGR